MVISLVTSIDVVADEIAFPECKPGSELAAGLDDILHAFGSEPDQYPNEFSLPIAFSQVFELHLSDGVSNRWSQAQFSTFLSAIMNDDTLNTSDDVFGKVWGYFCRSEADFNPSHAGVRFYILGAPYKKIKLRLYDRADVPSPCPSDYGNACYGYSWQTANVLTINASPINSMSDILGLGIAHELQHICWSANGFASNTAYYDANETLATLAEYFLASWRPNTFDRSYDASVLRYETCDVSSKYDVEKLWMIYLYETFKGNVSDPTDDLIYKWIRSTITSSQRMMMTGLANALWGAQYDWVGGIDATDRLNKAFGNFLVAKYANAPSFSSNSRFGITGVNSVTNLHFFKDNCTSYPLGSMPMSPVDCPTDTGYTNPQNSACWNVRILPPSFELSATHENSMTTVPGASGTYKDKDDTPNLADGDNSTDWVDVGIYGTDYITFRAGAYYVDGSQHDFKLRIEGSAHFKSPFPEMFRVTPVGWVLGYCCDVSQPQTSPQHLVFVEPITFSPTTTLGETVTSDIAVTDFGRSIKMVVVAISATSSSLSSVFGPLNYFDYQYQFGVFTPATTNVAWAGTVLVNADRTVPSTRMLTVLPGTRVRVSTTDRTPGGADAQKVEFNIEGTLIADGTAASPIKFESWTPTTTEDWVGFYFDNLSGGGAFDNCHLSRAEYAIESYKPLTVTNTTIEDCRFGAVLVQAGNSLIQGCTFKRPGSYGFFQTTGAATIRNTIIDDAVGTACQIQANASLTARNSQFLNSDKGIFVGGSLGCNIDSTCVINSNAIGIQCYNAGSAPLLKNSIINSNTGNGILFDTSSNGIIEGNTVRYNNIGIYCTNSSSPVIKSNMIKTNNYGVSVGTDANPDIGDCCTSGFNTIAYSSQKLIQNWNEYEVGAENVCWNVSSGDCLPPASKFYGPVNRTFPICCTTPAGSSTFVPDPEPEKESKTSTGLIAIVPNPFNPSTTIHYALAKQMHVSLAVFDVSGRLVRELVNRNEPAGSHSIAWEGTDSHGAAVATGIYFVRLSAGSVTRTMKMMLLK